MRYTKSAAATIFVPLAVAVLGLSACTAPTHLAGNTGDAAGAATSAAPAVRSHGGGAQVGGVVVANGDGWTPSGLDGPLPPANTCHIRSGPGGAPLPDPACTPGAVDDTPGDPGHSGNRRPPVELTDRAKQQLMASYGLDYTRRAAYELDHLVPVCAGGASDLRNLWPEPDTFETGGHASTYVHNSKDRVEDYLCAALRAHTVTQPAVQKAIAADWTTAVAAVGLPPIPTTYNQH